MSAPRPRLPWLPLRVALFLVAFVLTHYLGSVMTAGALATLRPGGLTALDDTLSDPRWLLLVSMGAALPVCGLSLLWWRHVERRDWPALGLGGAPAAAGALFGRGVGLGALLVTLTALPQALAHPAALRVFPDGFGATARALTVLAPGLLVVAWNEELACRGVLLGQLRGGLSATGAALLSSLLFAALHFLNPHLGPEAGLNLVLAGVMLALATLATGGLWFPAGLHFGWNLALGGVLGLPVSGVPVSGALAVSSRGPAWLTGGDFGPEGGMAATIVLVTAILVLYRRAVAIGSIGGSGTPVDPADQHDHPGQDHQHGDAEPDRHEPPRLGPVDGPLPPPRAHALAEEENRPDEEQRHGQ